MSKSDNYLDFEESFFGKKEKKENRKKRHLFRSKDRSKFKKSNQDQVNKQLHNTSFYKENLKRGRVLQITKTGILVSIENQLYSCSLKGNLKKEKTTQKNLITVGDFVFFEEKQPHSILHIEKRRSFLSRADHFSRRKEQLLAANIDQVIIVASVCSPPFKPFLIDRYIIAVKKGNMKPIIVINKIDLLEAPSPGGQKKELKEQQNLLNDFLEAYHFLGIPLLLVSNTTGKNMDKLQAIMQKKSSVFSGQSGVGKSSLINTILKTKLPTNKIKQKTNKGSHTTVMAKLIPIDGKGFCIDTPGIKSFEIWDISNQEILSHFSDFFPFASFCKFPNCTHLHEPDCQVKQAVQEKKLHPLRYHAYLALLNKNKKNFSTAPLSKKKRPPK